MTTHAQHSHRIALIPGDGIGPEVIAEAVKVLDTALEGTGASLEYDLIRLGVEHYLETGEILHDSTLQRISQTDAILFGAVGGVPGDPALEGVNIERGLLLKLRFEFDQYVNLRPARLMPGAVRVLGSDAPIDFVVVREGTEGAYSGSGGVLRPGTNDAVATEVSVNTARGVRRVMDYAFRLAMTRGRRLTVVHKNNILVHAGSLWSTVQAELAAQHPDVQVDYLHIDAATVHLVQRPETFDVIVTDNMFGDILTDLAGAISGGIGLAASGSIDPQRRHPSMFEPVHGSAPDIAGKGIADPIAAILSAAMMLDHLDLAEPAGRIRAAVAAFLLERGDVRTSTAHAGDRIAELLPPA